MPRFVSLATAEGATCAVRDDGKVECWGDSSDAVLELPEGNEDFARLEMGSSPIDSSACAIRDGGEFTCWGGIVQPTESLLPALRSLSLDGDSACAVRLDGSLFCWGFSAQGATSPPSGNDFVAVALGDRIACGIHDDGALECWGDEAVVSQVPGNIADAAQVCARYGGMCVRRENGAVECYRYASYAGMDVPEPNQGFTDVTCGNFHACAVRADGTTACWGANALVTELDPPEERRTGYVEIDAADDHTCGLRDDGSVSCWGRNFHNEAPAETRPSY